MSLYNLKYLQDVFKKENSIVLNKTGDKNFGIRRTHELTSTYKEKERVLSRIKERNYDYNEKDSSGQLYILDLAGTLVEQTFVLKPNSKELDEKIREIKYMNLTYSERIESTAKKLSELVRCGIEIAIVTDFDHGEETWIMQILHDIENALDDDCKNKIQYYAVGNGPTELGKANRNDSLVKWVENKPIAYRKLIDQHPRYEITFVDDEPINNLDKIMEDPKIQNRVNLVLLNSPKASIQSPNRGTVNREWLLFTPDDSTDRIIQCGKFVDHSGLNCEEVIRRSKKKLEELNPNIIHLIDNDLETRQFFCDLAKLKCKSVSGRKYIKMLLHKRLKVAHFDDWWDLAKPQEMEKPKEKAFIWLPFKHKYPEIRKE